MAKDVLVLAEHRAGQLDTITHELISKGRAIADALGVKLGALVLGYNIGAVSKLLADSGVDTVLAADNVILQDYSGEVYRRVISKTVKDLKASFFLMGYTYLGMEVGPAVAYASGVPLLSNCIDLELSNGKATVVRPVFGGTAHAKMEVRPVETYIISFQKGAIPRKQIVSKQAAVQSVPVDVDGASIRVKVNGFVQAATGENDICKADIIVSVGRGVGNKENIQQMKELAEALGGVVGCSRPVADYGWLPDEYHVGVSGKTVAPKVYLALGISGATQHVSGVRDSKTIIAINKDPAAPIFQVAHYGVVGNMFEIVPALIQEAKKVKQG